MKTLSLYCIAASIFVAPVFGAITVPGADGSDGVLNITANTEIDLSQAITGTWNANNAANVGKGIYDPTKWAVVFKYSSVNVASGVTVTFKNHASRAPVVWLVGGNVTIAGTVSLNGQIWKVAPALAEAGPGGFRGGIGYFSAGVGDGAGFGPGGGFRQAQGGVYGTGTSGYGNPSLIPLIGGAGGAGAARNSSIGGGAGAGAILIACGGTVTLNGTLRADGGDGGEYYFSDRSGGGAGGGIRLVCSSLEGTGVVRALPGAGGNLGAAGLGRIRLERAVNTNSLTLTPDPSVVPLASNATALIWPPSDAPEVTVVSVGGASAPADPRASFGSAGADIALPQATTTPVIIETKNVEQASQVQVRVTPRANANATVVNATVQSVVSTTPLVVRWTATLPVNVGYSAVQVKVVRP